MQEIVNIKSKQGSVISSELITTERMYEVNNNLLGLFNEYVSNINPSSPLKNQREDVESIFIYHLFKTISMSNLVKYMGKSKVLFIPSFKDSKYPKFTEKVDGLNYILSYGNISTHLYPTINKIFPDNVEVHVAYPPDHTSLYKYLMKQHNVTIINSNKMYTLGDEDYTIEVPENTKYDFVFLCGCDGNPDGYIKASDIKQDFSKYCEDNFILLDDYEDNNKKFECVIKTENNPKALVEEYNVDYRIRGDILESDMKDFASYITQQIAPDTFIVNEQTGNYVSRVIDDFIKLVRLY